MRLAGTARLTGRSRRAALPFLAPPQRMVPAPWPTYWPEDGRSLRVPDQIEETVVNRCNGETIKFTGTAVGQSNIVMFPGGPLHCEIHAAIWETGIGLSTRRVRNFHATYHEAQKSLEAPQWTSPLACRTVAM